MCISIGMCLSLDLNTFIHMFECVYSQIQVCVKRTTYTFKTQNIYTLHLICTLVRSWSLDISSMNEQHNIIHVEALMGIFWVNAERYTPSTTMHMVRSAISTSCANLHGSLNKYFSFIDALSNAHILAISAATYKLKAESL